MKVKKIIGIVFLCLLVAGTVWAGASSVVKSQSSGEQTSDVQIFTGKCAITAIQLIADGSNDASVTVHDGTANTDKKIGEFQLYGGDWFVGRTWEFPVNCETGIYIDITGTGASVIVEYID